MERNGVTGKIYLQIYSFPYKTVTQSIIQVSMAFYFTCFPEFFTSAQRSTTSCTRVIRQTVTLCDMQTKYRSWLHIFFQQPLRYKNELEIVLLKAMNLSSQKMARIILFSPKDQMFNIIFKKNLSQRLKQNFLLNFNLNVSFYLTPQFPCILLSPPITWP